VRLFGAKVWVHLAVRLSGFSRRWFVEVYLVNWKRFLGYVERCDFETVDCGSCPNWGGLKPW